MTLDTFQIMPNHVHAVLVLLSADPQAPATVPLGSVVGALKSLSAIAANRLLDRVGQPFWQRNYYERIIRDAAELTATRAYISNNPRNWLNDADNPVNISIPHQSVDTPHRLVNEL